MRLPVVSQISTKDGVSAKNARLTNCLKETTKRGDKAVIRPGLVLDAQASGVGNGLVVFNNELVSVYGATLGVGVQDGPSATDIGGPAAGLTNGVMASSPPVVLSTSPATPSIKTSTDGVTFVEVNTTNAIYRPFYGFGHFFGFDGSNDLYRSADNGVTWAFVKAFGAYTCTASEETGTTLSVFAPDYAGASYRFSSTDGGATWGAAVAIADFTSIGLAGRSSHIASLGKSFITCLGASPAKLISSSDSFATYSVVRSITSFTTAEYPATTEAYGKLYFVEEVSGLDVVLYGSDDGLTFDSGTVLYSDSSAIDSICCLTLNGGLLVNYNGDDGSGLISIANNGTIPALTSISGDKFDFAQSPI